ncbi:MAG: class II aldolase/adducin family protein [Xanthobacteraceae bacterium]
MTEALRRKLTNAGRVLAMEDQGDYVAGHLTVRLPDAPGTFLMKPATIGLDEMTPENIISVDLEGQRVGGSMPRHNEVFIHSEVLRARSDLNAVIHTHAPHAVAFSSLGKELLPVNNEAGYFYKQLPVFSETSDLIVTQDRGKAVARCLGQHNALILRNHGIVAAGRSLEEAVWIALKLERACRVQLMAEWAGGPKFVAEGEDLQKKNSRGMRQDLFTNVFNYLVRSWCRLHGKPGDSCCKDHYETDLSGYKG